MVALTTITNMSLHDLKEEKERQDRLADEAWAEVNLAMAEIKAAKMRLNVAKMKHKEAVGVMMILNGKIAEMEKNFRYYEDA